MVKTDIVDYYNNRGGNNHGLPVTVVHLNIGWWLADSTTDEFIANNGIEIVADDFAYTAYYAFDGSGTPHFAVVNGVENSPSHQQWEIVDIRSGWNLANPSSSVNALRTQIDSVQAPLSPPALGPARLVDGKCEFTVTGQAGRTFSIESTSDWTVWTTLTNIPSATGTITFRDSSPATDALRIYRVQIAP